jgi:hypothetical protein
MPNSSVSVRPYDQQKNRARRQALIAHFGGRLANVPPPCILPVV